MTKKFKSHEVPGYDAKSELHRMLAKRLGSESAAREKLAQLAEKRPKYQEPELDLEEKTLIPKETTRKQKSEYELLLEKALKRYNPDNPVEYDMNSRAGYQRGTALYHSKLGDGIIVSISVDKMLVYFGERIQDPEAHIEEKDFQKLKIPSQFEVRQEH